VNACPETELEASELRHMLFFYLKRRSVSFLLEHYWGGFTHEEIAQHHNVSRATVQQTMAKSCRRLRAAYTTGKVACEREERALSREAVKQREYRVRSLRNAYFRVLEQRLDREVFELNACKCGCHEQSPMCRRIRCSCCGAYWPWCQALDGKRPRRSVYKLINGPRAAALEQRERDVSSGKYAATDPSWPDRVVWHSGT